MKNNNTESVIRQMAEGILADLRREYWTADREENYEYRDFQGERLTRFADWYETRYGVAYECGQF